MDRLETMNTRQDILQGVFGSRRVVIGLQTNPETVAGSEEARQSQAGIGRHGPLAGDNLADAPLRNADFLGKPILRNPHRL